MEIVIKVKKEIIFAMEKANIFTQMEVIILVTGWKEKCKEQDNYSTIKAILSIKENGETIIIKVKESFIIIRMVNNGTNMKVSSDQVTEMGLENFFTKMETDLKVNLETILYGVKVDYSIRVVR